MFSFLHCCDSPRPGGPGILYSFPKLLLRTSPLSSTQGAVRVDKELWNGELEAISQHKEESACLLTAAGKCLTPWCC